MSCEFWGVLGRLTCDAGFRGEVLARAVPNAIQMSEAEALYTYLTGQGYRLDRYHFMEVNRVVSTRLPGGVVAAAPGGPFDRVGQEVRALCPAVSASDDLYVVLGVSYIDRPLRAELHQAAGGGNSRAFDDLLARPPGFRLAPANQTWVRQLYGQPGVVAALQLINDWAWKIPTGTLPDDAACDAGLTLASVYKHTPQIELRKMRLELPALRQRVRELGRATRSPQLQLAA